MLPTDSHDEPMHTLARCFYAAWIALICAFAFLTAMHLESDFPNFSPWMFDWAKYTDEGWYGNAAVRAHLFGNWYVPGDFNPAVTLPVLPFLEWLLFFFTGVSIKAARALDVAFFFASLALTYRLVRVRGTVWAGLMAVTLMVTSPFLYSFSRLAILEPILIAFTLAALNIAVEMPRIRRPLSVSAGLGVLIALTMLTKTTALFLIPAPMWAMAVSLHHAKRPMVKCLLTATAAALAAYGIWLLIVLRLGLFPDYRYLFTVNAYPKPHQLYWPLVAAFWSFHGSLWADHVLIPLAVLVGAAAAVAWFIRKRGLMADPLFGASIAASTGYVLFMTFQNHPQPRYFTVVAVFSFIQLTRGMEVLVSRTERGLYTHPKFERVVGWGVLVTTIAAVSVNSIRTVEYALHPQYSWLNAARQLTTYIDAHSCAMRRLWHHRSAGQVGKIQTRLVCDLERSRPRHAC
jgi:4-amino-4-deoxy-L-arabinose transferase-like glycosyltransferase